MAEVVLLQVDKGLLKKQLMKAVRDEDFWSKNKQLHDTPNGPSDERKEEMEDPDTWPDLREWRRFTCPPCRCSSPALPAAVFNAAPMR